MQTVLIALLAYGLGSISFAILVSRLLTLPDPRSYGSKNPGATNVLRSGSKVAAILTLAGDAGKGWLAAWLAWLYTGDLDVVAIAGVAAFVGHLFPVFHRFQGGKGVATAAGVLFALDWRVGAGTLATFLILVFFIRYVSLGAIVAAIFAPLATAFLLGLGVPAAAVLVMAALLVWRHRANISRLMAGTESRLGAKKPEPSPPPPSGA
ncbi:MAG TPA: glycerol-3-phosphate 1-O-acyltransferase PlsY [Burkholderiales bacterium]